MNLNHDEFFYLLQDLYQYLKSQLDFQQDIKLILKKDSENAKNLLGTTGYYNPNDYTVCLFTTQRHPKDILRSFAHEIIHHSQNCRGDDFQANSTQDPNYAQNNNYLREREREAYELGNILFRDWEDNYKQGNNLMENKELVTYKVLDKDGKLLQRVKAPKGAKESTIMMKLSPENFDKAEKVQMIGEAIEDYDNWSQKDLHNKPPTSNEQLLDDLERDINSSIVSAFKRNNMNVTQRGLLNLEKPVEEFAKMVLKRRELYVEPKDLGEGEMQGINNNPLEETEKMSVTGIDLLNALRDMPTEKALAAISRLTDLERQNLMSALTYHGYSNPDGDSAYNPEVYSNKTDMYGNKPDSDARASDWYDHEYWGTDDDELRDDERGLYEANKVAKSRKWKLVKENTYQTRIKKKDKVVTKQYKIFKQKNKLGLGVLQENKKYKIISVSKHPKLLFENVFGAKMEESAYGDYISQLKPGVSEQEIESLAQKIKKQLSPEEIEAFVQRLSSNYENATGYKPSVDYPQDDHEKLASRLAENKKYLRDCLLNQKGLNDEFTPFWKSECFDDLRTKQSKEVWNRLMPINKIY